jgi:hypothetical protein
MSGVEINPEEADKLVAQREEDIRRADEGERQKSERASEQKSEGDLVQDANPNRDPGGAVATDESINSENTVATDADDDGEPEAVATDYTAWTKDQLKQYLRERGVSFPKDATKDQLIAIVQAEVE